MQHDVEFRGQAGAYFGIWIVNIVLTVLTLGIYSAWAKVRTRRYFYGNTFIDGAAFDYHARPLQILIGRIIVVAALTVYVILSGLLPLVAAVLALIYLGLVPYLVSRGLRFDRRVTSYRNVRFDFVGGYGGAFWSFILLPFLNIFTLFLATPFVTRQISHYVTRNTRYGDRPIEAQMPVGGLYGVFGVTVLLVLLTAGSLVAVMAAAVPGLFTGEVSPAELEFLMAQDPRLAVLPFLAIPIYLLFIIAALAYFVVGRNALMNAMVLDRIHRFRSSVSITRFSWITISNFLVCVVTLALMIPWARIRVTRYMCDQTKLIAGGPLDAYAAEVKQSSGVVGAEFMDLEGVDVGAAF